ncbi:aminotransferase class V-fold PLP-dependent enzyme [Tepidibacillus fermentans]|uniref:cysteine desulfurase n=1 Tax=Tepidibacillus fermentans TaxID=1281767 RepID=A0A4V2USC2_9BACI|nr:aminotransferase class V-fold PLP-dependent enzyme [Tepidibacillus fermentans]TCS80812.1 cysteine desulfurase family protein [Tepidibacillus fermentans]
MIYFDHAASSWPKPKQVIEKMVQFLTENGANPGRGNHKMADIAGKEIYQTRVKLAKLFHIQNPNQITFFMNTTQALNLAIKGLLSPGDHVITTKLEHNSVRRPLEYLKKVIGVEISYLDVDHAGYISLELLKKSFQSNTKLLAISHASNVLGSIQPIKEIGQVVKEKDIYFLLDSAQTAGRYPIHVQEMNIDLLAFPGHKGLLGPQGVGGLYIHPELQLTPLIHGGTGKFSEDVDQPSQSPERYESGTLNTVGIVGLGAALDYLEEIGIETLRKKEWALTQRLLKGLEEIEGVKWYGPDLNQERVSVVSFTVEGIDSAEIATILDQHYEIAVRSGFHCSPLVHQTMGTSNGAIRASLGYSNTEEEVDTFLAAIREIALTLR